MAYVRMGMEGGHSDADYNNLMDQLVEESATGAIESFTDGANDIACKQVICHINPTETGTGEKSPQNPYVIGGFTEANITQTDGQTPPRISKLYTVPFGQTVYGGSLNVTTGELTVDKAIVDMSTLTYSITSWGAYRASLSDSLNYGGATLADAIAEKYTVTTYSNLNHNKPNNYVALYNQNIYVVADASPTGQLVYPLAEPITHQLTPTEVKTLLGANNIYHDCNGDIDVTYRANGALYVAEHMQT